MGSRRPWLSPPTCRSETPPVYPVRTVRCSLPPYLQCRNSPSVAFWPRHNIRLAETGGTGPVSHHVSVRLLPLSWSGGPCLTPTAPTILHLPLTPNPPMRSGLGVGTRGEGRGTRRSALDSDKWGRWRPLVVVGGADGGPGQRRWGGVGGTACRGRQSRTGPVRLCGSVG